MSLTREEERIMSDMVVKPIEVFVKFYDEEIVDTEQSDIQGRRVTKDAVLIQTKVRGDRHSLLNREATQNDFARHPKEYNLYLEHKHGNKERTGTRNPATESPVGGQSGIEREAGARVEIPQENQRRPESPVNGQSCDQGLRAGDLRKRRSAVRANTGRQKHQLQSTYSLDFGTIIQ